MTASDWLASRDPRQLLRWLIEKRLGSARKPRLFAVACRRRCWRAVDEERSRRVVEVVDQ